MRPAPELGMLFYIIVQARDRFRGMHCPKRFPVSVSWPDLVEFMVVVDFGRLVRHQIIKALVVLFAPLLTTQVTNCNHEYLQRGKALLSINNLPGLDGAGVIVKLLQNYRSQKM